MERKLMGCLGVVSLSLLIMGQVVRAEESQNLLENPGFEEVVPLVIPDPAFKDALPGVTDIPKGWWINYSVYPGMLTVMYDPEGSHGGMKYVRLEQESPGKEVAFCQRRFESKTGEKYDVSLWVKGEGEMNIMAYQYDLGARFVGSLSSGHLKVSSEDWSQLKWTFTIPEETVCFTLAFHVNGIIDLDDAILLKKE